MEISGINGASAATATTPTQSAEDELGKEQFLELLVAQLQNQNPLAPQDGTEFIAQLATFANLEQLTSVNQGIDSLAELQLAGAKSQAIGLVGKGALFEGNRITVAEQGTSDVHYTLPAGAEDATLRVFDSTGTEVATLPAPSETGLNSTTFDGFGNDNNRLPPGDYTFTVTANVDGEMQEATPYTHGKIEGITFESDAPILMSGDLRFTPAQVLRVLD